MIAVSLALAVSVAQVPLNPSTVSIKSTREFAIRADLSLGRQVNAFLATVALQSKLRLPDDVEPRILLAKLCGERAPTDYQVLIEDDGSTSSRYIQFVPCLRHRLNAKTIAREGDDRETVAVRFGMRRSSASQLKIVPAGTLSRRALKKAVELAPGDTVIAPVAPAWTMFSVQLDTISSRDALVSQLAAALGCASEVPERCLARRSVYVLERAAPEPRVMAKERPMSMSESLDPIHSVRPHRSDLASSKIAPARFALATTSALYRLASTPTDVTGGQIDDIVPVAPEQWPYDQELVALELSDAVQRGPVLKAVIGIADGGLASSNGLPLKRWEFVDDLERPPPEGIEGVDDNDNEYYDDFVGAGVIRDESDAFASGDVSLCAAGTPNISGWSKDGKEMASHGSIVASISAGTPLLLLKPELKEFLPRLLFYRLARNACSETDDMAGGEFEAVRAIDYIINYNTAHVINLSFFSDGPAGVTLSQRIKDYFSYHPSPLLVMAAGNYISTDLDQTGSCPACLGNATKYSDVSRRVLVVGAAERNLRVSSFSGYGAQTVRLFAPGEPKGAIDLAGNDASSLRAETSYATPLVSLGAGIARALGIDDVLRVRNRLLVSTWPLFDAQGLAVGRNGGPQDVGVLDLVKVAAIRRHALEIIEDRPVIGLVRKTYVGTIKSGLTGICPGLLFTEVAVQAIRFGQPSSDGTRPITVTYRKLAPQSPDPLVQVHGTCKPTGSITIDALRDGTKIFPITSVTQILFGSK